MGFKVVCIKFRSISSNKYYSEFVFHQLDALTLLMKSDSASPQLQTKHHFTIIHNNTSETSIHSSHHHFLVLQIQSYLTICSLYILNIYQTQMQRKIVTQLPDFPKSESVAVIKDIISKLLISIPQQKNISTQNKEIYTRALKQIEWGLSKVHPRWPEPVETIIDNLKKHLIDFEQATQTKNSGSSFLCGANKGKDIQLLFRNILGFQQVFPVIGHYQDKNIKQDLINQIISIYEKQSKPRQESSYTPSKKEERSFSKITQTNPEGCQNCKLYLSLSLQPNGSLAKSIIKTIPNNQWLMGILYEQGKIFTQDLAKAAQYYERAAAKNNSDSIYRLGCLNERGQYGRPYEYLDMWKKAAEMGNLEAITDMGFIYEKGLIDDDTGRTVVPKSSSKAYQYYLKAVKENFPRGLNNLGSFYQLDPSYKNKQKSIECFTKAVEAGYVKAMLNLALCYSQGFLGTSDMMRAKQLFKRAADLGDHHSKLFYVDMLLNGNISACSEDQLYQAHRFCRQMIAEEEDRAEAYYFLGILQELGLGVPQSAKTAFLYFTKAAELNYVHGILKLGDCYRTGFGVQKNHRQALKLYEQASKTKPQALVKIGMIYEQGSQMIGRDYDTAFKYYFQACNKEVIEAYNKLGNCYKMGRGCKRDEYRSRQYLQKYEKLNASEMYLSKTNLMGSQSQLGQSSYMQHKRRF